MAAKSARYQCFNKCSFRKLNHDTLNPIIKRHMWLNNMFCDAEHKEPCFLPQNVLHYNNRPRTSNTTTPNPCPLATDTVVARTTQPTQQQKSRSPLHNDSQIAAHPTPMDASPHFHTPDDIEQERKRVCNRDLAHATAECSLRTDEIRRPLVANSSSCEIACFPSRRSQQASTADQK
jgi:hypothetical protein